ncbi:adenosine kinase [Candidatus Woesearchaeota archaeon]|nr:adenosine kinase [Candidatus Woesearchaeota archaeon]
MKKYDIFGIGSALMDFLIEVEDNVLVEMDMKKGEMHLIDEEKSKKMLEKLKDYKVRTAPGGSSANTLAGVASFGGSVVFCGKIGNDKYGEIYEQKSNECGVCTRLKKHAEKMTGHAISFITPDSERTFATHLGAAIHLKEEDIFDDDVAQSRILHIEGYQLEDPELRKTSLHAMNIARKNKTMISIDLSDPGLVKRNLEDLKKIIRENADIVFANESEAKAFTGKDSEMESLSEIAKLCKIAIVKTGKDGSLIRKEGKTYKIPAFKVDAVDTTGAGDMYAAGVLFGIAKDIPIERAGRIGSWAASKVVSQIGARLNICLKDEVKKIK